MEPEDQEPFFTSNPLGLPYNRLPDVDPNFKKPEKTWLEYVIEGNNERISDRIEEMRDAAMSLNFDEMMDAFEEIERARRLQISEIASEIVDLKRAINPTPPVTADPPSEKKKIIIRPKDPKLVALAASLQQPKAESSGIHPAIPWIGIPLALAAVFWAVISKIAEDNKPIPKTPHELYLEQKREREKPLDVRLMEAEDALQEEREGRPIGGTQDNRGHSDE